MFKPVVKTRTPGPYAGRSLFMDEKRFKNAPSFDAMPMFAGPLYDKDGYHVPIEKSVWRLPSVSAGVNHRLNWDRLSWVPAEIAVSFVQFMRYNVSTKSSSHCSNAFGAIVKLSKAFDPQGDGEVGSVVLR